MVILSTSPMSALLGNFIIVTGSVALLFFLIKAFAWKQLTATLEERASKISGDLDKANGLRQQSEELVKEREEALREARIEASRIVAESKTVAQAQAERLVKEAKLDAQAVKEKARLEIAADREKAMAESKQEITLLSLDVAQKILGRELDEASQHALIDRYLTELGEG